MIVLGIETATPQTSIALGGTDGVLASVSFAASRAQREAVVPALEDLLARTGLSLGQVAGIVTGLGPGLFTGLRVGVETAKSLAQVLRVPILGIPSLDSLAFSVRHTDRVIAAVIDARRGEVFSCLYRPSPGGVQRSSEFSVGPASRLAAELEALGEEVLAVGNGAVLYRDELVAAHTEVAIYGHQHPDATSLVELAVPRFMREERDDLFELVPIYLRKSDAELAWDDRTRAAG